MFNTTQPWQKDVPNRKQRRHEDGDKNVNQIYVFPSLRERKFQKVEKEV